METAPVPEELLDICALQEGRARSIISRMAIPATLRSRRTLMGFSFKWQANIFLGSHASITEPRKAFRKGLLYPR